MTGLFTFQNIAIAILFLLVLFAISIYRRPTVEHFEASQTASLLESKANQYKSEAERLRNEANTAAEKCKQLGVVFPDAFHSLDSLMNGQRTIVSQSMTPVSKSGNTMTVLKSTTELASFDLKSNIQDILNFKIPIPLSETEAQKVEETKLKMARALAAEAQAQASSLQAEAAREQVTTQTVTLQNIPVSETTKNDASVQAAAAKAEEASRLAENLAREANEAAMKATETTSAMKASVEEIAEAQKQVDSLVAEAAKAAADAAAAKVEVISIISKVETSPQSQEIIQSVLEADRKMAEAAASMAAAAEAKAEVSNAEAELAAVNKKISESETEIGKISSEEDRLNAEEELRKKLTASDMAAAEAQRKKAEQMMLEAELEEKKRKEAEERRLYAIDTLNKLLQRGIIQSNDDTYSAIMQANTKGDIDSLAEQATTRTQLRKLREVERETRFNSRLKELNEVRQGRAVLSLDEEQAILNLESEEEFQLKKQELKKFVEDLIRRQNEEAQRKIDEINRIQAEKEKEALAKLVAMSPMDRATFQMNDAAQKQEEIRATSNAKFEEYKKRVLSQLADYKRILSNDQKNMLMALPNYEEFDKQVRTERMKNETPGQKIEREEEERKFEAYKAENIKSLLQSDNIFSDQETINKLKKATNYDHFTELSTLEFHRKKQAYFDEIAKGQSAQMMALFAQNMEPTRKQIVDQAFSDGWITREQYDRLLITSINTPEKFDGVQNEIKESKMKIINQREEETKRRIEAAIAEQKAKEEAERKRREEEERQVQQAFLDRRASEVAASSGGMFGLTQEQQQDLLSTDNRLEFTRKKEKYLFDNLGCCIREGENRADFANRRQNEVLAERAAKERKEREAQRNKEEIAGLFSKAEENLRSNNRFWKADAERDLKKLNELKSQNLSDADFLTEYRAWMDGLINELQNEAKRKEEEAKRKQDFYTTLNLDTQANILTTKDTDGLDVKYFRIPNKTMGFSAGFLYNKTAQQCLDEIVTDPTLFGFDRTGHVDDDRGECSKLSTKTAYFWNVKPGEKNQSMFVRQDYVARVPGVDSKTLEDANAATSAYARKKEEVEIEKKLSSPEFVQKLLSESQIINIEGTEYRVFPGKVFPQSTFMAAQTHFPGFTNSPARLMDAHNDLVRHGAKSFVRDASRGLQGERGRRANQQDTTFLTNEGNAFKLSSTDWRAQSGYATYIPVANLPAALRISGFADYTNTYHQRAMSFPATVNTRYMTNQNKYLERANRMLNYSLFHPAM